MEERLWKSRFLCVPFPANIAVVIVVIVAAIMIAFLYLHASDVQYTNTGSIEAEYKTFAHIRRGSYPISERLVDV